MIIIFGITSQALRALTDNPWIIAAIMLLIAARYFFRNKSSKKDKPE